MKWDKDLYVGESIAEKATKIKWKILHNVGQIQIYVITLSANSDNLLDIISSKELMQKYYPKKHLYVVGLSKGYDEALEVAKKIIENVYEKTGTFTVREYILKKNSKKKD